MTRRMNQRDQRRFTQHVEALNAAIERGDEIPDNVLGFYESYMEMLPEHIQKVLKEKIAFPKTPETPESLTKSVEPVEELAVETVSEEQETLFPEAEAVKSSYCPRCNKSVMDFYKSSNPELSLKKHIRMCKKPYATAEVV